MGKYKYFGQPMHIHSCYQPGGSMEGQIYHAAKLGMQYTWFTDHDNRIAGQQYQIETFDFEQEELYGEDANGLATFSIYLQTKSGTAQAGLTNISLTGRREGRASGKSSSRLPAKSARSVL